ncbi:uncharacterized protein PG986_007932 [Apiospora aurea]|uniref:GPI anchored serine-rich protein n=1 Tax=Apiospora aurea TaxID=335848 RepID=A0ABR1QE00_9PEZI
MHAPSFVVLAAGAMSASAAYMVEEPHSTTTSTSTLTHFVTITKCNPTNTLCPLYSPTTTPSPVVSFPALNSTTPAAFPTAYYNTTTPKSTLATPTPATLTSVAAVPSEPAGGNNGGSGYPTAPAPSPVPTGGAASVQAGLMMVMGAVAALVL